MLKQSEEEMKQIDDFINRLKKPLSVVIPNDFYRNAKIEAKKYDKTILS